MIRCFVIAAAMAFLFAADLAAQDQCPVQGTWARDSVYSNGQGRASTNRWIKIVNNSHFSWFSLPRVLPSTIQSTADTLAYFRSTAFGAGTYEVVGTTYTEHVEYGSNPQRVGRSVPAKCTIQGGVWRHEFQWPTLVDGKETGRVTITEVLRRIG